MFCRCVFRLGKARLQDGTRNGLHFKLLLTVCRPFRGPLDCFIQTFRREGIRALYKGASAAVTSALLENAVVFTVNGWWTRLFQSYREDPAAELPLLQQAIAGSLSAVFSSLAMCPAEVVKCQLQVQLGTATHLANKPLYSPLQIAAQIAKRDGIIGFWRGIVPLLSRDIPFYFVFFGSYSSYCEIITKVGGFSHRDTLPW